MRRDIAAWMLASLCYDEKGFPGHVEDFLLTSKYRMWLGEDGCSFYGYVEASDDDGKILWIFTRGTDGDNLVGKLRSWRTNLEISTSGDGVCDGIQRLGNEIFNRVKKKASDYRRLGLTGHSQGADVTQYLSALCAENLPAEKIYFNLYGSAPAGNMLFKQRMDEHFASGRVIGTDYMTPYEPLATGVLRNPKSKVFNGVDLVEKTVLPLPLKYLKTAPMRLLSHSPQIYNIALILKEVSAPPVDVAAVCDLYDIGWRQVC